MKPNRSTQFAELTKKGGRKKEDRASLFKPGYETEDAIGWAIDKLIALAMNTATFKALAIVDGGKINPKWVVHYKYKKQLEEWAKHMIEKYERKKDT
jgi:hypothetical protein